MGSVAIAKGGKVIYLKSVGFTDVERGLRANENSRYRIGSISNIYRGADVNGCRRKTPIEPDHQRVVSIHSQCKENHHRTSSSPSKWFT